MIAEQHYGAHSARVNMWLIVNGASIGITHMGPDFLLVEPDGEHPPGDGTIVLQVDSSERRWKVRLPDGVSRSSRRVTLALNE
jgi:hypothetical protein